MHLCIPLPLQKCTGLSGRRLITICLLVAEHTTLFYLLLWERGRGTAQRNFRWAGWNSPNWNLPGASGLRCWIKILLFWTGCEWSAYPLLNTLACSSFLPHCQRHEGNHPGVASWLKHKERVVSFPKNPETCPVAILLFPRGIFAVVLGIHLG